MAIIRVHPHLIDSNNTSNGSVLLYSAANGVVEFGTISTGGPDNNAWVNANDYSTLQSAYANDYSTLLTTAANDWNTLQTARANDYSTYNALDTNVFNTYNTLTANIYNTFAYLDSNTGPAGSNQQVQFNNNGLFGASSSLIFDGATLKAPMLEATQSSGDEGGEVKLNKPATNTTITNGITIDVYQDKVRLFETGGTNRGGYWDITSLSAGVGTNLLSGGGGGDVANAWVNANDYNTLTSAYSNDGATLLSARANDYSTLLTTAANDWNTLLSARANDYTTLLTTAANDYATFTTLTANTYNTYLATVNTTVFVGNTRVSNSAIILAAGNGVSLTANATSKVITFTTSMSNVTSEIIEIDGTANTFTLAKAAYNTHMVIVSYNGLLQDPRRYVLTNNAGGSYITINNTSPLIADSNLEVRYFDFFDLPGISSGGGGGGTQAQGTISGYTSGGQPTTNIIDKFPFATNANATDVGDLTVARIELAGQSSTSSGYSSGGQTPTDFSNIIDKFPFASNANATDVGDLTQARRAAAGQSSSSSGYTSGGETPSYQNIVDKFPFATDGNATDVGDLTRTRGYIAGQSSTVSGYTSGGTYPRTNIIDKFPFATNGNATDVGDLTTNRFNVAGQNSSSHGYTSGGYSFPPQVQSNIIDKFPFAADGNASDVGDLTQARFSAAGQSSTSSGYTSGGFTGYFNTIDKFSFAADANATDVGDLTAARFAAAGQQV